MEGGNEPEKLFRSRKSDLRFVSGERSGIGPESELLRRLMTRSWSSRVNVFGEKKPVRFND